MTFLELINGVLLRLRKSSATTSTDTAYVELIGEFVEQALREVESAWDWNALRTTIQVTTAADDYSYSLTGVGPSYSVIDVLNATSSWWMKSAPNPSFITQRLLESVATESPQWWDQNGFDANDDPIVNVYPIPDGVYTINFNVVARTVIALDTDTVSDVYSMAVRLRATMHALEERGDDGGSSLTYLQDQYTKVLGDAIAFDAQRYADETTWYVD